MKNYLVERMSEKEYRIDRRRVEYVVIRAASRKEAVKEATVGGYVVNEKKIEEM